MPIEGKVMKEMYSIDRATDVNYRALGSLNYSMVKLFDSDPVKFYDQFKLGKVPREKHTTSLVLGDIVDFYILECKGDDAEFESRWDEKFVLFDGVKSGQVFQLADVLFEITQDNMDASTGKAITSFSTRFKEAFQKMQAMGMYKGKTEEKALKDFNDNAYDYFQALSDNLGKTVVDVSLMDKARLIAKNILQDEFTKGIFDESEDVECFMKLPIEWKYLCKSGKTIDCKSEPDILRVDHRKKTIYIMDCKTTFDNENFEYSYVKHRYYLQNAFYYLAVKYWSEQEGMNDYTILPMAFIVGDTSSNNRRPIIYRTNIIDVTQALDGFKLRGISYKGMRDLIEEISWAEDNDVWNCSKLVYDNKGRLNMDLKYE